MPLNRRAFAGSVVASPFFFSGLAGELRGAEDFGEAVNKPARILFNENPLGPSPKVIDALAANPLQFSRYPLSESFALAMKLRKRIGLPFVEPSKELSLNAPELPPSDTDLVLGVGSSELLHAAVWSFVNGTGNVVEPYPSYAAVGRSAAAIPGAKIERRMIPLTDRNELDTSAMIEAIDEKTKIVVVCNPNNPTGSVIPLDRVAEICEATPPGALVLVDEAYIEFVENAEKVSALSLAMTKANVLVTRTFSKIYGLAGLRLGYGIGSTGLINKLKPHMLGRLSMNMPAILAANAALDDDSHVQKTLELTREVQESWNKTFPEFGYRMTPSITCFGWVDLGFDCTPLVKFLAEERGVLISGGQRWELPNCVRISIGTLEENDRLLSGIRAFHAA
ncbi:MAG: histidinol-phosphate transaminase [Planctomycetota bacterium]